MKDSNSAGFLEQKVSGICHRHLEVAGKTFLLVQVGRQKLTRGSSRLEQLPN